jgi:hypothetical protein
MRVQRWARADRDFLQYAEFFGIAAQLLQVTEERACGCAGSVSASISTDLQRGIRISWATEEMKRLRMQKFV